MKAKANNVLMTKQELHKEYVIRKKGWFIPSIHGYTLKNKHKEG